MLAVHIASENDTNGNPRRGWFITDDNGDYVDFVDSRGGESRISMQQAQVLAIRLCLLPSDSIPPNERFN